MKAAYIETTGSLSSLEFWFDEWSRPKDMLNMFMLMAALTWGLLTPLLETAARLRLQLEWESLPIECPW